MVACWLFPSLGNQAAENGRSVFTFAVFFYVEIVKNTPPPSKPVLPTRGLPSLTSFGRVPLLHLTNGLPSFALVLRVPMPFGSSARLRGQMCLYIRVPFALLV